MERLSSGQTYFLKRIFPALWFAMVVAFAVFATAGRGRDGASFYLVPIVMAAVGVVFMRKLVWDLADEVRDAGTSLLVRRGDIEERVELANIFNVDVRYTNPPRVTLRLRQAGRLGREIVFMPKAPAFRLNPFARNEVAERLIERVDAARRNPGRTA